MYYVSFIDFRTITQTMNKEMITISDHKKESVRFNNIKWDEKNI